MRIEYPTKQNPNLTISDSLGNIIVFHNCLANKLDVEFRYLDNMHLERFNFEPEYWKTVETVTKRGEEISEKNSLVLMGRNVKRTLDRTIYIYITNPIGSIPVNFEFSNGSTIFLKGSI